MPTSDGRPMLIARTEAELAQARARLGHQRRCALVPTMGALHDGHLALVDAARADGDDQIVVSIFVNPLQFEAASDFARYPVDHDRDLAVLRQAGCSLVWLPSAEIMYPPGHATTINVGGPAIGLEGSARPGHFRGVATVVATLIGQTLPRTIWFGEKDWQQFQVIQRMIADLRLPVSARSVATVRASDGLALSSRNRFLSADERAIAPALYACLRSAAIEIGAGSDVPAILDASQAALARAGFSIEYLVLADGGTLVSIGGPIPGARLLAAVRLGSIRLLDNVPIVLP